MVEDLGAADGGGRRGFQAELRPRKAEEWVSALLAATKEIGYSAKRILTSHPHVTVRSIADATGRPDV